MVIFNSYVKLPEGKSSILAYSMDFPMGSRDFPMDFQQLGGTWAADWGPGGPTWPSLVPDASPMRRKVPKRALAPRKLTPGW